MLFFRGPIIFDVLKQVKIREDARSSTRTRINNDCIDLYNWNKMRVSLAKIIFEIDTINEIIDTIKNDLFFKWEKI